MKRAKRVKRTEIDKLQRALEANGRAQQEGPKRKKWTEHDLKSIKPITPNQEEMFHEWFNGQNICAHGVAGSGKTFLALYLAFISVIEKQEQHKIIIVRSAVQVRTIGHLPGTIDEKLEVYEMPYRDICTELFGRKSTYDDMKDANIIEFMPTSFIRGLTWDNAIIIIDEINNLTWHEIDSVITRTGQNSRIIAAGDIKQTDLEPRKDGTNMCGVYSFLKTIKNMKEFSTIHFTIHDIVRSQLVKSWIIASQDIIV